MALTSQQGTVRKLAIDPDSGNEVPPAKKALNELNANLKEICLKFYIDCHYAIHLRYMHKIDPEMRNINIGVQTASIIAPCFAINRQFVDQISGGTTSTRARVSGFIIHFSGSRHTITLDEAMAIFRECANNNGLATEKNPMDEFLEKEWCGVMGPYINLFTGFGLRWKELRLGHQEFIFT